MDDQKIENLLNLSLDATDAEREKSETLEVGYNPQDRTWQVIVRYHGDLRGAARPGWIIDELTGGYGIVTLPQTDVDILASLPEIEYVEKPKRLYFSLERGRAASCVSALQTAQYSLLGEGVLVAVIDSGVDYFHPDFRDEDGNTRILAIWDQSAGAAGQGTREGASEQPQRGAEESTTEREEQGAEENASGNFTETEGFVYAPPAGFSQGIEYTKEMIDAALAQANRAAALQIVSEQDLSGHGTHVLGIAAGNGRASGGRQRGMAPRADILAVKLGTPEEGGFPRTTELMEAIEYVIRKAEALHMPVAVNLSFGNAYGSHRGTSLLETYLSMMSDQWKNVIVVGMGNEGNSGGHFAGRLPGDRTSGDILSGVSGGTMAGSISGAPAGSIPGSAPAGSISGIAPAGGIPGSVSGSAMPQVIEFSVSEFERTLNLQLWKNYVDEFRITVVHPNGSIIGPLGEEAGTARYRLGNTELLVYYGRPSPYQGLQEIYIDFLPSDTYIDSGIWRLLITPRRIVSGEYEIWMPDSRVRNSGTHFLQPSPDTTLTVPATSARVIAVGAYDARRMTYAPFSGRGWETEPYYNKPDLAAPGVDIISPAVGGGYASVTGTSFAAPFVTGAAALLMQWGIVEGNDPYLYGEKVRAYLRRGARQLPGFEQWPNNQVGYGALCVRDSLPV